MNFLDLILERNARFAATGFKSDLEMLPSSGTVIVGCVDPRVDPVDVLGLKPGEAAVIRNVGGRVNKPLTETLAILRVVAKAAGREGGLRNLILLHHTDCGIVGCYRHAPHLLAQHFGVELARLDELEITDPYKSVVLDTAALKANEQLPAATIITGLVYDVRTGRLDTVHPSTPLRQTI